MRRTGDADPVAWRAVSPGTPVVGGTGGLLGIVIAARADYRADIFQGFELIAQDGSVAYLPGTRVERITRDCVETELTAADLRALELIHAPGLPRRLWNRVRWFRLY